MVKGNLLYLGWVRQGLREGVKEKMKTGVSK